MIYYRTLVWLFLIGVIGIFLYLHKGTNICDKQLTDNEYINHMITHHEVAVYMSENHLHNTKNPVMLNILHLFTFQTPILTTLKKIKRHKINSRNFTYDGLIFSSSVFILEEVKDEI